MELELIRIEDGRRNTECRRNRSLVDGIHGAGGFAMGALFQNPLPLLCWYLRPKFSLQKRPA